MKRCLLGMNAALWAVVLPACTPDAENLSAGFSNFTADFTRAVLAAFLL
jgi:hypothetical protein